MNTEKSCLQLIFLGVVILFLLTIFFTFIGIYLLPNMTDTIQDKSYISTIAKNFVQIIFFITTGIVALLSYYQAKKGLLNPIKTEIFKSQFDLIKEFPKIFGVINSKKDLDIAYSIEYMKKANLFKLFFDYELIENPKNNSDIYNNYYRENFFITNRRLLENQLIFPMPNSEQRERMEWKDYSPTEVLLPNGINHIQEELKKLIMSPLFPVELRNRINNLYNCGEEIILRIGQSMETSKDEVKVIMDNNSTGLYPGTYVNLIKVETENLYQNYQECINYISDYLKIDELIT